ncbi:2-dehydropantoate 2-reductase [Natronococcus amylolyticus DSM 10524]|uniref:2-dehydropantoate 2-reductase n=1 Tax=Natronococcus amylolyticus DSM 10524 TaxID=1227497 RepID=L9XBQ6_9EURY|nr:2-dehydropantoate 2-reductase [Natronococcus amylolyticus]ELY59165.1 2-dehydropantoate 2-reductase [Natronococcus amylolyticus DSM 10524]
MEIVVFGAGSLGSLVGGVLARDHEVTLVGREAHVDAVRERELALEGELEAIVEPQATTDGTELAADLAVVTVKSYDTRRAAETLATGAFDAVLSLQNGMGNEELLAETLGEPVLAGTASYGAVLREPGIVECTGVGEIVLGDRRGGGSAVADRVGEAFRSAGLETTVSESMPRRLWEKLAVNAAINPVTALTATENAAVLEEPAADLARGATRETARVARAEGVGLSNREALAATERVVAETAANTSSMHQDVLAERRTEIDAINGYVLERAAERGLEAPTNRTLASLVRTWERGRGLR